MARQKAAGAEYYADLGIVARKCRRCGATVGTQKKRGLRPVCWPCSIIREEFVEPDGYWIVLHNGWVMPGGEHSIVESTKQAASARLSEATECRCASCRWGAK